MALNDIWDYLRYDMEKYQNDILKLIDDKDREKSDTKHLCRMRSSILHRKYLLIKEVLDRKITGINLMNLKLFKNKQEF